MTMADQRDAVSKTMGSLLIRGYKMLADSCPACNSVLMQDRKGVIICVNCNSTKEPEPTVGTTTMEIEQLSPSPATQESYTQGSGDSHKRKHIGESPKSVQVAEAALLKEIESTADGFSRFSGQAGDINSRLAQVQYIRECAEAIKSLQDIRI